jgi:N-acetylneuraminic acid mutarotase
MKKFILNPVLLKGFVLSGLLALMSAAMAQVNPWTDKAKMLKARLNLAACEVNGKIYSIGGTTGNGMPGLSTVEEYDPVTNSWTEKAEMPTARTGLSASAVNGKIYAIGGALTWGGSGLTTMEEYDPSTNTWTTKAGMPTARANLSTCVVNGKIYAIGGAVFQTVYKAVEEYDPVTDTWITKADMPTARAFLSASTVNGKIYVIGGGKSPQALSSEVEEYDPASDTWISKSNMATARAPFSSNVVNDKIYVIGGVLSSFSSPVSIVEEYDPATDSWTTKTDMPTARSFLSASAAGGKVYVIGGSLTAAPSVSPTDAVEEYDPGSDTALITSVESNINMNPGPFELCQNYPNPFHISTSIRYKLDETAFIKLSVYDLLGHEVGVLVNEKQSPGEYEVTYNAENLVYGIYYYKMQAKSENGYNYAGIKKLVLSK